MKEQGGGGSLLFMSSVTGHQAHKNLAAYGMTKAALEMLARNLVIELSPFSINVNTVAPGATLTERTKDDAHYEKTWSAITPMGRPATTTDIAAAALFPGFLDKARHIDRANHGGSTAADTRLALSQVHGTGYEILGFDIPRILCKFTSWKYSH